MKKLITLCALGIAAVALSGCTVISSQLSWFADGQTYAGEVHNFTNAPILGHTIDVRWFDSSGKLLRTDTTIGCLRSIPAGGSDFFESRGPAGSDVAGVTAQVSDRVTVGAATESGLTVSVVQATRDAGSLSIAVTLANNGAAQIDSPRICVVVRNAAGNVVRMIGLTGAAVMAPGYEHTTRATAAVPYNGDLSVEVWSDALLAHGVIAKPVRYGPVPIAAPVRLTGIASLDPILHVVGSGSPEAVRPYIGYGQYVCRAGLYPPGGDPCRRPEDEGHTIPVFSVGGCEGALIRPDEIGPTLDDLASRRLQLYGVYRAALEQGEDYVAVYASVAEFTGNPNSRYAASLHITDGRITRLEYSCGASDPAQLAGDPSDAVLAPQRLE